MEGRHPVPPGVPPGLPQPPVVRRDEAIAGLCEKLTELAEIGRHFLQEVIDQEREEREANRQRREERLRRGRG